MIRFIESKLRPPHLSLNIIKRDRLIERLRSNLDLSASFVCAGQGWGKTTVAAEFINSAGVASAWYDLDSSDADIAVFFQYLVRAVQQTSPDFGHSTLNLLSSGIDPRSEQLAELFLYELSEVVEHQLIVVLDNIHHTFTTPWSLPVLYRILQLLPENVHFVLLARVAPGFTFSRLRSKQAMDLLDDRALAFNGREVRELFRSVVDEATTLDKLLCWTHGWVAGLQIVRKALEAEPSLRQQDIEGIITRSEKEMRTASLEKTDRLHHAAHLEYQL
jgi:LuxR family maltose regulon positive regulatory protein